MPITLPPLARFYLYTPPAQTIATGVLNVTRAYHTIDTEGSAATDDLDTISGLAVDSMVVTLRTLTSERAVVLKHNTGNLYLPSAADVTLNGSNRAVTLAYNATLGKWQHADEAGFLLCDFFTDTRAAGAVNSTPMTPGPGTRVIVDTGSNLSVGSNVLNMQAGAAAGNPGLWANSTIARTAGRVAKWRVTPTTTDGSWACGWDANQSGALTECLQFAASGNLQIISNGGTAFTVGAYSAATTYDVTAILLTTGVEWYIKGGAFTAWTRLFRTAAGTTANLYLALVAGGAWGAGTAAILKAAAALYLATPLAYTVFGGAAGDLNGTLTDSTGPDGQATPQKTWACTAGAWALSGAGTVGGTPTLDAEMLADTGLEATYAEGLCATLTNNDGGTVAQSGDVHGGSKAQAYTPPYQYAALRYLAAYTPVAGTWYLASVWAKRTAGANGGMKLCLRQEMPDTQVGPSSAGFEAGAYTQYFVSYRSLLNNIARVRFMNFGTANDSVIVDDVSLKPLALNTLFSSITTTPSSDVSVEATIATLITGTQAGLVARLDSPTTPTAGIVAYFYSSGAVRVDEFTTATTWTNLFSATKAFTAGDTLRLDLSGNAIRCYHIAGDGTVTLIGTGTATANTNTNFGLFSTYSDNTFSKFQVFPKGTGNEYAALEAM